MENRKFDFIIVGAGISGAMAAHFLCKKGMVVLVLDDNFDQGSSKIAAGIINPVTGRRFVKSWMVDELIPFAKKVYAELEQNGEGKLLMPTYIKRKIYSKQELDYLEIRSMDSRYDMYLNYKMLPDWVNITECFQVDLNSSISNIFTQESICLTHDIFEHKALEVYTNHVKYKGYKATKIIFCEGAKCISNPWFKEIKFNLYKGEIAIIRAPNLHLDFILKDKIVVCPIPGGEDNYWVGSYDGWINDYNKTKIGLQYLISEFQRIFPKNEFEIVSHTASVRPTIKDRRPTIGAHPDSERLVVFNGMGTKGTSLAPYFGNVLVDYLLGNNKIPEEVNCIRFFN